MALRTFLRSGVVGSIAAAGVPFRWCGLLALGVIQAGAIAGAMDAASQSSVNAGFGTAIEPDDRTRVLQHYGRLPLSFEENHGQADGRVRFYSRGSGYSLFLTERAAVLSPRTPATHTGAAAPGYGRDEIRMELTNANRKPRLSAADQLPGSVEFLVNDEFGAQITVRVPLDAAGRATYTTDKLAAGSYPVAASYAVVDGDFGPSSSPTLNQIIETSP